MIPSSKQEASPTVGQQVSDMDLVPDIDDEAVDRTMSVKYEHHDVDERSDLDVKRSNGRVSDDCFRIVMLTSEIQNDVGVIKPVLDELGVVRLCCAMGMLTSVNPKDFDFDMLVAEDFDEDVARFLRSKVFGRGDVEQGVRVLGLFGKQPEVKRSLVSLGLWSVECEAGLSTNDQGIYCIKAPETTTDDCVLVMFAWLNDELFEATRVRDTATYVLRFLACMSSDVQCCLATSDIAELETVVGSQLTSEIRSFQSFSVAFHVEKQEDAKDGVHCDLRATTALPRMSDNRDLRLIKGSYPAVSFVARDKRHKIALHLKRRFDSEKGFAIWVVEQAKQYRLEINFYGMNDKNYQAELLKASGEWPSEQLSQVKVNYQQMLSDAERQILRDMGAELSNQMELLKKAGDEMFSFNSLLPDSGEDWKKETFTEFEFMALQRWRERSETWSQVDPDAKTRSSLPIRLKSQMKGLYAMFCGQQLGGHENSDFDNILRKLPYTEKKMVADRRISTVKGGFWAPWNYFRRTTDYPSDMDEELMAAFRAQMIPWLDEQQTLWWDAVEQVLALFQVSAVKQTIIDVTNRLAEDVDTARANVVTSAFDALMERWNDRDKELVLVLSPRKRAWGSYVTCECKKDEWKDPSDQLHVFKLNCAGSDTCRFEKLGFSDLVPDERTVGIFTIGNFGVLLVTTLPAQTRIYKLDFSQLRQSGGSSRNAEARLLRQFGRGCVVCDFNFQERLMAFVVDDNQLFVYRFNSSFSSMEMTKHANVPVQTSLSTVVDVLVSENAVFMEDDSGAIQSLNIQNMQISRKVASPVDDKNVYQSGLMLLSDGLALGRFSTVESSESSRFTTTTDMIGSLTTIASEDFREIPAAFPAVTTFLARKLMVECVGDFLFVVDELKDRILAFRLSLTVRSDSYRIRHSNQTNAMTADGSGKEDLSNHWLRAFYHMYEKFPVGGLIPSVNDTSRELRLRLNTAHAIPKSTISVLRQYLDCVTDDLRKLNKTLGSIDLSRDVQFVHNHAGSSHDLLNLVPMSTRSFVQNLITFVPVQICRAQGNALTVMANGLVDTERHDKASQQIQAADLARSIRFGLLSPLLSSWNGPCVVITSMGKQSTGKSYMLNHLTGSSFAIAGARCTDGAWMSIRLLAQGTLLVVLDFEGLGSFERTEQEDVLLSVLNTAISMFTIFRMEMRFDKEIEELFARFQKGVALLKSDPKLFNGMLYMSVKDVNPNDHRDVLGEFVGKLEKVLGANKEHNFLTDLYTGKLEINCSPPLGTSDYYRSLGRARECIESGVGCKKGGGFGSGKAFLDCLRLVLAKISILDWTSLDESAQQFVLSEVMEHLPGLIRAGCLVPRSLVPNEAEIDKALKERITGDGVDVTVESVCAAHPALAEKWIILNSRFDLGNVRDDDIDVKVDVCCVDDTCLDGVNRALNELWQLFLKLEGKRVGHHVRIDRGLQTEFQDFVEFIVRRRCLRISQWVKLKFDKRVPDDWKALEKQYFGRFVGLFARCQGKCGSCRLGCMQSASHTSAVAHNCGTDHQCREPCKFCLDIKAEGKTPLCSKEAGHDGDCECQAGDHTCGHICCLAGSPNCGGVCTQKVDHDGDHRCGVTQHACGQPCSLTGCPGLCILNVEIPHTAHKCVEVKCTHKCIMDGCSESCSEMDHFHGQPDVSVVFSVENQVEGKELPIFDADSAPPVVHMCDKEHSCPATCNEEGICRVEVFLKQSSRVFSGARGTFRYTYQEMNGSRKKCGYILWPKQQTHEGCHTCITTDSSEADQGTTMHYCDVRCPCCSYYCSKEFGHFGAHATSHGNMRNTYFLSDTSDIDIEDRKYQAGEAGEAEMCNLYCSKMGRAHVHYLDCDQDSADKCVYSGSSNDQRRHCTRLLEPKPDHEMDEVLHDQFWRTLGWEDPCLSAVERELFKKCAYQCDAPDHKEEGSHCLLPAWHAPVTRPSGNVQSGMSYVGGHQFECSHVANTNKIHHVLVLDASGSMSGQPWSDLMAAVNVYLSNRITSGALLDLVSIVTFANEANLVYEAQSITLMANASVHFDGGGTSYAAGLRLANEVLSRSNNEIYMPALVFFSDGQPHDQQEGLQVAEHINQTYAKYDLQAFAVGFGYINLGVLESVANKLGGAYHNALTGSELKTTFHSISASVNTRAGLALARPLHEVTCPICCNDLASGKTMTLKPCLHTLHAKCFDTLMTTTAMSEGMSVNCPVCRCTVEA